MHPHRIPRLRALALHAIDRYQTRLSPRKGYRCAYAVEYGGSGCSGAVRESIATRGLRRGAWPAAVRLGRCARVGLRSFARRFGAPPVPMAAGGASTQGVCCLGCIPIPFRF